MTNKKLDVTQMMSRLLEVSRSGYYDWVERPESLRQLENKKLAEQIKKIYEHEKHRSGSRRIMQRLRMSGHKSTPVF